MEGQRRRHAGDVLDMPYEYTVEQQDLVDLARRLKSEGDGKKLKRELNANIRKAAEPSRSDVRAAVMALTGVPSEVRTRVASSVQVQARSAGSDPGARIRAPRKAAPGFVNAPKAFERGWRHKLFGRDVWFDQRAGGSPYWKDAIMKRADESRKAVIDAIKKMSERLAGRR